MQTIALKLEPMDVLFFRDARPFGAADHGESDLPTPQTLAGAIKTHLMQFASLAPADLHGLHDKAIPDDERHWFTRLQVRGPWLLVDDAERLRSHLEEMKSADRKCQTVPSITAGPVVPVPADVIRLGKEGDSQIDRLRPLPADEQLPGWTIEDLCALWHPSDKSIQPVTGLLDTVGLQQYLQGRPPEEQHVHDLSCFVALENRTGIGIDPATGVSDSERGLIYSASFLRLRPGVCFYGEVAVPNEAGRAEQLFPSGLTLSFGGERRRVAVERTVQHQWPQADASVVERQLLTLLVTPGVFSLPKAEKAGNGRNEKPVWMPREQGTLIAAAIPKPLAVSGWDLAGDAAEGHEGRKDSDSWNTRGRPRPTRFAVPAGAVYFWERGERKRDKPPPHLISLCDRPQDRDNGWGLCLSGVWKECDLSKGTTK